MNLGKKLQDLRNKNNISQEDIADKLNVSRQTISNWENSKSYPDILLLIDICKFYNISLDDLIKEDEELLKSIKKEKKKNKLFVAICSSIILILLLTILYSFCFEDIISTNKSINKEVKFLLNNNDKFVTIMKSKKSNKDEMTDNYIKISDSEYKQISSYLNKNNFKYNLVYRFTNFHMESTDTIGYVYSDDILGINHDTESTPYSFWTGDLDIVRCDDFNNFFENNIIGRFPINSDEIMISNVLANKIINSGIKTNDGNFYPKDYDDVISFDNYYMLGNKIKIVGIINYDLSKYDNIKDITWKEINDNRNYDNIYELYGSEIKSIYNKIYVTDNFIPNLKIKSNNNIWDIHLTRVGVLVIEDDKNKLSKLLKHFNNDLYEVKDTYNIFD